MKDLIAQCSFLFLPFFLFAQHDRGIIVTNEKQPAALTNGNIYAIVVGISNYSYIKPLNFADNDAELFAGFLRSAGGGKIKDENLILLTNEMARSGHFWANFVKLSSRLKEHDRFYIYFAGHGDASKDMNEYFLLLQDCQPGGDANNYLIGSSAIQIYNLKNRIGILTKKGVEVLLVLDACRSNELPGGYSSQAFNQNIAESKTGEIMMLATGQGQVSIESNNLANGHGLFTYALIDGLSGLADKEDGNGDGRVSLAELQDYVRRKVRVIAERDFKTQQTPYFCCSENENRIISGFDSVFYAQWESVKRVPNQSSFNLLTSSSLKLKRDIGENTDTTAYSIYNLFIKAIKEVRLWGDSSANYYYDSLKTKFPNDALTESAMFIFIGEGISFAQKKINLYIEGKDPERIERLFSQRDANNTMVRNSLIRDILASKTSWTRTEKIYTKAMELLSAYDSNYTSSLLSVKYLLSARSFYDKSKSGSSIDEALRFALKAYALDKNSAAISHTISVLYRETKSWDSAKFYARAAINNAPNWVNSYINLGEIYIDQELLDSAKLYYSKAIEISPNDDWAYNALGVFFHNGTHQYDSAKYYYRKALSINPKFVLPYNNLGVIYTAEQRYDSAKYYFRGAIAVAPWYEWGYKNFAWVFHLENNFDSALHYYNITISINSKNAYALNNIGLLYHNVKKQYDSAMIYYNKALLIGTWHSNMVVNYNIACMYSSQKLTDSALIHLEKSLSLGWKDMESLKTDTDLEYIRNTPEFVALMRKYLKDW